MDVRDLTRLFSNTKLAEVDSNPRLVRQSQVVDNGDGVMACVMALFGL